MFRLQYDLEERLRYTEQGSDAGAKLSLDHVADGRVRDVLHRLGQMGYKEGLLWLRRQEHIEGVAVVPVGSRTPEGLQHSVAGRKPALVLLCRPLHTVMMLDEYLAAANEELAEGGYLWCHTMTSALRRAEIMEKYPPVVSHTMVAFNYAWHRICPKMWLTRRLYYRITEGKARLFSRPEVIGRLCRAGFDVVDEQFREGEFFVAARKVKPPTNDTAPTGSLLLKLRRVGKDGKEIDVYKLRTMYTYSEYAQAYVYRYQNLDKGGKFKGDYRITGWGRLLRRVWLDELPMVWNMIKGDMKLVGVRPLSRQYFSLYTPEMQALRTRTKPGLLPPYYYEAKVPETLEEVQANERRYLESYLQKPFATDWKYFWGIVGNIIFRRKRSK